jgi:hypothetical protein
MAKTMVIAVADQWTFTGSPAGVIAEPPPVVEPPPLAPDPLEPAPIPLPERSPRDDPSEPDWRPQPLPRPTLP